MRKAKSRLPHNKLKKRYKNIFGGYFYVGKNDSKNSILVVASSWITGFLLFIFGNSASAKTIDHNPLVSFETIEEQHQEVNNINTIITRTPPDSVLTKDEIKQYIEYVFGEHADEAFKVLECENKTLNPRATNHNRNGSIDRGIFQLNSKYWGGEENFDPKTNIDKAYKIFNNHNKTWEAWTCSYMVGQDNYLNK